MIVDKMVGQNVISEHDKLLQRLLKGEPIEDLFSELIRIQNKMAFELERLTFQDQLTQLPNRKLLRNEICLLKNKPFSLLLIDIDGFGKINDTFGHVLGDNVLIEIGKRIRDVVHDIGLTCHMFGDEFGVLLPNVIDPMHLIYLSKKIVQRCNERIKISQQIVRVTVSIGIAIYPSHGSDEESITKHAETAMYAAKSAGRNTYKLYATEMNKGAVEEMWLKEELHKAIEENIIEVYYQPKMNLQTGEIIGSEALARWKHHERGFIPPNVFIPVAEKTGLIVPLGGYILENVCLQIKKWESDGLPIGKVSVNVSAKQILKQDSLVQFQKLLEKTSIHPSNLELEITERTLMVHNEDVLHKLNAIRNMGIHISIDDFGVGYSSLGYLQLFPVNTLKIDLSFVQNIHNGASPIVTAIIALGCSFGLELLAEGVETKEQFEFLKNQGCHAMQGYLLAKPMPVDEFEKWCQKELSSPIGVEV